MNTGFDAGGLKGFLNDGIPDRALASSADLNPPKLAVMLINAGFSSADLTNFAQDGIPDTEIAVIAEYYGFEASRCRGIGSCRFLRQLQTLIVFLDRSVIEFSQTHRLCRSSFTSIQEHLERFRSFTKSTSCFGS